LRYFHLLLHLLGLFHQTSKAAFHHRFISFTYLS